VYQRRRDFPHLRRPKIPQWAGRRSAMTLIGASHLGWASASLEGRRNGVGVRIQTKLDGFRQQIGMFAKAVTRSVDLQHDGVLC